VEANPSAYPARQALRRDGRLVGFACFALAVTAAIVAVDLVLAATLAAALAGRGWHWRAARDLISSIAATVHQPGPRAVGWPRHLWAVTHGAKFFWASFGVVLALEGTLAASGGLLVHRSPRRAGSYGTGSARQSSRRRPRASRWATSRRPYLAPSRWLLPYPGRNGALAPLVGYLRRFGGGPLPDHRNSHGFASARQVREEASLAAARRRAAQTRPSLTGVRRRLPPNEVGYPFGRLKPSGPELWPSWEASLRLVAPPGEGKTFRALAPILRQHPGPALATSTKADLYELTAVTRGRTGPVFALDPDQLVPAAAPVRWSPVAGCERSEVAERRATALLAAAGDDADVQNAGFFRDSARDLLKAYLHAAALEGLGIGAVLDWSRRPEEATPMEVLASSPFAAPGWADLVSLHTTGAPETTSGVMRYVARALACFSHQAVIEACSPFPGDELNIERALLENGTLYLVGKGSRLGSVAPLVTAFADEVFDCAERLASRMPARRLDPPLLGLLDEAPSIAPLPSLPELLADGRGRGIVLIYAMQSFSQAVTRWGAHKAETMGNATTITAVLGGLSSASDLSDLERLCGQRKVRHISDHQGEGGRGGRERSRTIAWENEPVVRADQVRTLPAGTALVLWSRLPPVLAHLPLLSETPGWAAVREEEAAARRANDEARALLVPEKKGTLPR
jgi:type IV secretory pathway TraG/TraD family ATPase VirD4